ncbi:hypothetical protein GCK72_005504 [Caenorhabditis remanei]|nr:hypothetical protein GCK72_005504 [Caenorhabditis remanei]KAF1765552.1 hypothetical protein GCK72_005504 [Caenorhabditis remanei]
MSFVNELQPVPFETTFGGCDGERMSRENCGNNSNTNAQSESHKRRKSTSVTSKKRAKMTRGDENITDETAKQAATELLDQIAKTPGQIALNLESPEAAGICPLPPLLLQQSKTRWSISLLEEGQLRGLLASNPKNCQPLGLKNIHKGHVETQILPRQMNLKEAIETLKNETRKNDSYVGFGVAVANILRRCNDVSAEKLAQVITAAIETEATSLINK